MTNRKVVNKNTSNKFKNENEIDVEINKKYSH